MNYLYIFVSNYLIMESLTHTSQVENTQRSLKDAERKAQSSSITDFKITLVELILSLNDSELIEINLSESLFLLLKNDLEFIKMFDFANVVHEDEFQLNIKINNVETNNSNLLHEYKNEMRLFLDSYYHINTPKYNQDDFATLIMKNVTKVRNQSTINFSQWFISVEEYNYKHNLLIKAKELFENINSLTWADKQALPINQDLDKEEVVSFITLMHEALIDAKIIMENEVTKISRIWKKEANTEFTTLYNKYFLLKENVVFYTSNYEDRTPIKPSLLNFKKSDKDRFQIFEKLKKDASDVCYLHNELFKKSILLNNFKTIDDLNTFLNDVNLHLSTWVGNINTILMEKMDRINILNINNPQLVSAVKTVDEYIIELNQKQILTDRFEINSMVFTNYINSLDILVEKCGIIIKEYNEVDAKKQWNNFITNLSNKDYTFISKFFKTDSKLWVENFENYFCDKLLSSIHHPLTVKNQDSAKEIFLKYKEVNILKYQQAYNHLAKLYSHRFNKLSKENSKLFKQLSKEKIIVKSDFYKEDIAKVSSVFPLRIELVENGKVNANIKVLGMDSVHDFSYIISEDDRLENLSASIKKMNEIPMTQRFSVANAIATSLLEYVEEFSIFQLKNANIVCLMPSPFSDLIQSKLDINGVKQFNVRGREKEALIESIVEAQRAQVLIMINGLPNYTKPEEIVNQYKIMEAFIKIGFNIINIWSVDLLENPEKVFDAVVEKLDSL